MINSKIELTEAEEHLADILWKNCPISSPELVKICEQEFDWKKSTTYTMLKRLESKKIFANKSAVIQQIMTKEEFISKQGEQFIKKNFGGSLPRFITAFANTRKLDDKEIQQLQDIIDFHKEK